MVFIFSSPIKYHTGNKTVPTTEPKLKMKRSFSDSNILIVLISIIRTKKEMIKREILINIIEEKVELSFSLSLRSTETDLIPVRLKP